MTNILIIEDNEKLAQLIQQYLQKKGMNAVMSSDGTSAFHTFSEGNYDLILADIKLPSLSGDMLCKKVRESSKGVDIPIILMSGITKEPAEIERMTKELNLSGFLIKPFPSERLYTQIKDALSAKKVAATATQSSPQSINRPNPNFKGFLDKTPFERLLFVIMERRGAGILTLTCGARMRKFYFVCGAPVDVVLLPESDNFGNYMVQRKLASLEEYNEYEERKKKGGEEDPRDIFIKMGCLTIERFQEENRNYLLERLIDCFSWKSGTFLFEQKTTFMTSFHSAYAYLPHIFYEGLKKNIFPDRINTFFEQKGKMYIGKTSEFFEYRNYLPLEQHSEELFDLIDGSRTCSEIIASIDMADESLPALIYMLDYIKVLSFTAKPQEIKNFPAFPVRGKVAKITEQVEEQYEDPGEELINLADELEGIGGMEAASPVNEENEALSRLEEGLKLELEGIKDKNYYEIFDMTANTFSFDSLKKAYFALTRTYGPEKFFASSGEVMSLAEEFLSKVSDAYSTLSNVVSKENYDELISSQGVKPGGEEERDFYVQIQFQSGKVFLEQGQYESAEKAFMNCVNIDSNKPEYQAYLAVAIYSNPSNRGNPSAVKRAKELVNKSLQYGKLSIAYALKGTMLLDEGSMILAEAEFTKALKLNPNNKTALKKMDLIREKRDQEKRGLFQKIFK